MKTIEERAAEYADLFCDGNCAMCDDIGCRNESAKQDFIAGAKSERYELLCWEDLKKPPIHTKGVLLKLENENGNVRYTIRPFMFGRIYGHPLPLGYHATG